MKAQLLSKQMDRFTSVQVSALIIIVTHFVGIFGFTSEWRELFLKLTPLHLIITFVIVLWNHGRPTKAFLFFATIVMTGSFLVEFLGVNTGLVFGQYEYGTALGLKVGHTPILIGILWLTLIYCIGVMINGWISSKIIKSIIGAGFMVLIDIFIEPAATNLGFWNWYQEEIPIQNYFAWFVISFMFFLLFFSFPIKRKNPIASIVYFTQLVFFMSITMIN